LIRIYNGTGSKQSYNPFTSVNEAKQAMGQNVLTRFDLECSTIYIVLPEHAMEMKLNKNRTFGNLNILGPVLVIAKGDVFTPPHILHPKLKRAFKEYGIETQPIVNKE
jgi:hypothetical protein